MDTYVFASWLDCFVCPPSTEEREVARGIEPSFFIPSLAPLSTHRASSSRTSRKLPAFLACCWHRPSHLPRPVVMVYRIITLSYRVFAHALFGYSPVLLFVGQICHLFRRIKCYCTL